MNAGLLLVVIPVGYVLMGALVMRIVAWLHEPWPADDITFGITMWPGIIIVSFFYFLGLGLKQPWRWVKILAGAR